MQADYEKALKYLAISEEKGMAPFRIHQALGSTHSVLKNWTLAEKHYLGAVGLTKNVNAGYHYALGWIYQHLERWDDVDEQYEICFKEDPTFWKYPLNFGYIQAKSLNKQAQAAINFKKSIDLDITDEEVIDFYTDTLDIMEKTLHAEQEELYKEIQKNMSNSSYMGEASISFINGLGDLLKANEKYIQWIERQQNLKKEREAKKITPD